jgi:transcriptional regulator with GAF, ATPase, and Fis domain
MTGGDLDLLSEGVRILLRSAAGFLPAVGLGVVRKSSPEHAVLTYVDAFGATEYCAKEREVPEAFRPDAAGDQLQASALEANPWGLVESRLLHTGFSDEIRQTYGVRQVVTRPIADLDRSAILLVGLGDTNPLTDSQISQLDSLAAPVVTFVMPTLPPDSELEYLRRLEAAENVLPSLFKVLDVREIFDRLSTITKEVLRHDFASLGILNDDLTQIELYVQSTGAAFPQGGPMPYPPAQTAGWLYRFVDDLSTHPLERTLPATAVGGRSSLRVAIRVDESILGALNFTSFQPVPYTAIDLAVARRLAAYVGLALTHNRLAEQARRSEVLRARAEKSDLLDQVLASVTETGTLPEVFDRVSDATQKVLAHDALLLAARLPGGRHAKVYASKTPNNVKFPDIIEVPPYLLANPDWEFDIVDDLQVAPGQQHLATTKDGYRSTLRVPIRLDNEFVGGVSFCSFTPGYYVQADVPVARRIAERIALSFSRERGAALLKQADEATARASKLESRVRALTDELDARTGYRRVVGESAGWRRVLTQATQVASTDTTVLLLGESGTGKEVVARFLHRASTRNGGPFIALNCAALPEQLLEAELFGYERGAYTGAIQSKPGQLEQAAGGTLFLDEVAEMSPSAQAKFLRVLQEREFQRLGGTRILRTDARIVAATNRDLQRAIVQGQFREDLYYRLNVFAIQLPPLRERPDDVLPLSEAFLAEISRGLGRPPGGISREARKLLIEYHWPGNVRELRNILERAAILCEGALITAEHLSLTAPAPTPRAAPPQEAAIAAAAATAAAPAAPARPTSAGDLLAMERTMIEQALQSARFNKSKAARALGLTRQQLYVRMRKFGLE